MPLLMLMRRFYTFLLYLFLPFLLLRLYWKGRKLPAYRDRIKERFSLHSLQDNKVDIWIHAVSLGEVVAATALIEALLTKEMQVLVTTMTPTGSAKILSYFNKRVQHQYIPYDYPFALRKFFNGYKPRLGIIMETELWPNLIHYMSRKIPLILVNARLSDKAAQQYQKARFFFKPVLRQLHQILTQSQEDAEKFVSLGAFPATVKALGNMKFESRTTIHNSESYRAFQSAWGGVARPVLIAASTHANEEELLLWCFTELKKTIPNVLLLIVPRHPERFQEVFTLGQHSGWKTNLRSQKESIDIDTDILIIDSIGELPGFYQLAHYAFVGGSLVPIGGHNVLEPIALNVPVITGPFMHNSKAICNELQMAGAMRMVQNKEELVEMILFLYQNPLLRDQQIQQAQRILVANQGCINRYLSVIERYLV